MPRVHQEDHRPSAVAIGTCLLPALLLILTGCAQSVLADGPYGEYAEPYRPGYHFSPARFWMNEPNGPIYYDGQYHVFYQHNPYNSQWGNMSWGHAVSTDLVHWTHRPVALPGEDGVMCFSGTAVYDSANSSGLGTGGGGPLVAVYTGWNVFTTRQDQRLAFSNDGGLTWTKYAGNPVLDIGSNEFRDPKVFWHAPTSKWVMVITHGGQKKATFWQSSNLKNWIYMSEFTGAGMPADIGGWEVPDMFELPVDGNPGSKKWVLVITPSAGSPAGGNGVMYFVGQFNGTSFTSDNPPTTVLWADYGRDFDGVLSWENIPTADGRRIWSGIMNSYGTAVPTTSWRGNLSIPREVTLSQLPQGIRMIQQPIVELQQLRGTPTVLSNVLVTPTSDPLDPLNITGDMLEIIAVMDPITAGTFGISVREGTGEETRIGYNLASARMFVDRTLSGGTDFNPDFGGVHNAPLALDGGIVKLHMFVDRGSVEVFGNDGKAVISDMIFPDAASLGVSAFATGGNVDLISLEVYPLQATWTPGPPPEMSTDVVARWSMDPLPHAGNNQNPVIVDSRTLTAEGDQVVMAYPYFELCAAIDNLWLYSGLPGGALATSTDVPPATMFVNGHDGGDYSYNAGAFASTDGVLYCPVDQYGDEFSFDGSFYIEIFFKTNGNQSSAGYMQLLLQGETGFRYGIIVNEGGAGNVRFAVNDGAGHIPIVDINDVSGRNYADGQWHYLLAEYDADAGFNGELRLTLSNEDNSYDTATHSISGAFHGLPGGSDGNLLIGREDSDLGGGSNGSPRTFRGLIDEVQISKGLVNSLNRLGAVPILTTPGDMNCDNVVNAWDIELFARAITDPGAYTAQYPGCNRWNADVNGDEVLDSLDAEPFVAILLGS